MHRSSTALAVLAGAALIATTAGAALGQEESPLPDASMAPEAEMAEPSTLTIADITGDGTSRVPLKGKKLKKAIAKAMPVAARFAVGNLFSTAGVDNIDRIIELSRTARVVDETGDPKSAKALIDIATLLYRNEWSKTKSDPLALNEAIEAAIAAGDYPEQDRALALWSFGDEGLMGLIDICFWPEEIQSISDPGEPTICEGNKGRQARVDNSRVDGAKNGTKDLYSGDPKTADAGGVGIHKIIQDSTANNKLAGKKYKKALANVIKKSGAEFAGYTADERGVIEMVSAARAADESGHQKAAKAVMGLALAAYRSGVLKEAETAERNAAIDAVIQAEYIDVPGLELYAPLGSTDFCFASDGTCEWAVGKDTQWECDSAVPKRTIKRVTDQEAEVAGCQFG
jgi:hypothetical protein